MDENDNPVEGVSLRLSGRRRTGVSAIATFSITSESDKGGIFELLKVIPNKTDEVTIIMEEEALKDSNGNSVYAPYLELEGVYSATPGSQHNIPWASYGKK